MAVMKKMNHRNCGDDANRLLRYVGGKIPFQITGFEPIRKHVFYVQTKSHHFILKAFPSYQRYKLQEAFTSSLKKEGFSYSYTFLDIMKETPLFFENRFYGCIEFIEPSSEVFSFRNRSDQIEGLRLLQRFHHTTGRFANRYHSIMSKIKLLKKWQDRVERFLGNLPVIKLFIQKEMISEILNWAFWSLNEMEKVQYEFEKNPKVILHGDVAHHNFLRDKDGVLYLIDFDLMSTGNPHCDYLQYANRILPYLDWSLERLGEIEDMRQYLANKPFLLSLAYPADIFREWNRLIIEKEYGNPFRVRPVLDLTVGQFQKRRDFIREIKSAVTIS